MRLALSVALLLFVCAVGCQVMAYRRLVEPWRSRFPAITWSIPKREYFTRTGWRFQMTALMLALAGIVAMIGLSA
jgi:hypothetical protein